MDQKKQIIMDILEENCPHINFDGAAALVTDKVIDSIELVQIISDLEDAFEIEISMDEVTSENFDSVDAIMKMIDRLS